MKKTITIILYVFCIIGIFSQEVEKLGELSSIKYKSRPPVSFGPYGLGVDEVQNVLQIGDGIESLVHEFSIEDLTYIGQKKAIKRSEPQVLQFLNGYYALINDTLLVLFNDKNERIFGFNGNKNGISFILKKRKWVHSLLCR